jgi:hypothetical protein
MIRESKARLAAAIARRDAEADDPEVLAQLAEIHGPEAAAEARAMMAEACEMKSDPGGLEE